MSLELDFKYKEGFRCVTVCSLLAWLDYETSFDKKCTGKMHQGAIQARERLKIDLKKLEPIEG